MARRPVPSELIAHGRDVIDSVLRMAEEIDPGIVRPLANLLAEHAFERAGSVRSGSGRIRVPVVVARTPVPPKK